MKCYFHLRAYTSCYFACIYLWTCAKRGTARTKWLAQGPKAVTRPGLEPGLLVHTLQPIQCFDNRRKAVWLARYNYFCVCGVWECNPNPKPLSKTSYVLTAIVFVISVRAVVFSVAHICCREAFPSLTGKHAGGAFTIVFVWFIFTCKVTITAQIFLDTFAIFARKLLIATPVIFIDKKRTHTHTTEIYIFFAAVSQKLSTSCYDWFWDFPTLHQPTGQYQLYMCYIFLYLSSLHLTKPHTV